MPLLTLSLQEGWGSGCPLSPHSPSALFSPPVNPAEEEVRRNICESGGGKNWEPKVGRSGSGVHGELFYEARGSAVQTKVSAPGVLETKRKVVDYFGGAGKSSREFQQGCVTKSHTLFCIAKKINAFFFIFENTAQLVGPWFPTRIKPGPTAVKAQVLALDR